MRLLLGYMKTLLDLFGSAPNKRVQRVSLTKDQWEAYQKLSDLKQQAAELDQQIKKHEKLFWNVIELALGTINPMSIDEDSRSVIVYEV